MSFGYFNSTFVEKEVKAFCIAKPLIIEIQFDNFEFILGDNTIEKVKLLFGEEDQFRLPLPLPKY